MNLALWQNLKPLQKVVIFPALVLLVATLAFFLIDTTKLTSYVPLTSSKQLQKFDIEEIQSYLEENKISYKISGRGQLFVPRSRVFQIRREMGIASFPRSSGETNSAGPQNLQALERQLERDIARFQHIRTANIIFDFAPAATFSATAYENKASVILSLVSGTRLTHQQVRAIIFHISSAVSGLSPNMIAVSDTTGKLYHSIDPNGAFDHVRTTEILAEEHIKSKLDGMLATLVGYDNFYADVQVIMQKYPQATQGAIFGAGITNPSLTSLTDLATQQPQAGVKASYGNSVGSSNIESILIGIMVNRNTLDFTSIESWSQDVLYEEIEKQLATILARYDTYITHTIDFVPFDNTRNARRTPSEPVLMVKESANSQTTWIILIALSIQGIYWLLIMFQWRNKSPLMSPEKTSHQDIEELLNKARLRIVYDTQPTVSTVRDWLNERKVKT